MDLDNPHVLWRLARVLAEKAEYIHDHHKQAETLKKAVELAQKAVQLEGAQGISGAHKWLAIAQYRLLHADKKAVKDVGKVKEQIWAHFKKAADLAPNDPYAQHFLGLWFDVALKLWIQILHVLIHLLFLQVWLTLSGRSTRKRWLRSRRRTS